jgi:hypothetical protein
MRMSRIQATDSYGDSNPLIAEEPVRGENATLNVAARITTSQVNATASRGPQVARRNSSRWKMASARVVRPTWTTGPET